MTAPTTPSGGPARCGPPSTRSGPRPTRCAWSWLLSDPALLSRAADGLLDPDEQAAIIWATPPRGPGSARWSAADAVLIDETRDLIERTPSLAHVVVDEAQDLSPMECRAIGRRCATGSATVLGDLAQGTTPWATASWAELLGHLGKQEADLRVLETGYRVPRQILDFASRLLDAHRARPGRGPLGAPGRRGAGGPPRRPGGLAAGPGRRLPRRAGPARLGRRHRRRRPAARAGRRADRGRPAARHAGRRRPPRS